MSVHLALTAALCITLVEIVRRLPFMTVAQRIGAVGAKVRRTVGARAASDHWKERAMRGYARKMAANTAALAFLLGVVACAVAAGMLVLDGLQPGFGAFLMGETGLIASALLATAYAVGRAYVV